MNGLNQYSTAGSASFTYDANGNLTSDGSNSYIYDPENRLVSVTGGHTANLVYDPLGRLQQIDNGAGTITKFVYDGDALVDEYNGSGTLTQRYLHGTNAAADDPLVWYSGGVVSSSTRHFLRADHEGSIIALTNSSGGPTINSYDEYGIPGSANSGRFQYTGQAWLSEVGMYYYKARIYSPTLGRFLQTDPIGYKDQINLYEYVGDDPVDNTDFSGDCPLCIAAGIGALVNVGFEAVQEYHDGHFSATGLAAAAAGGAVGGVTLAVVPAAPELAGAATGFVQAGSKSLLDGDNTKTALGNALSSAAVGALAGNIGKHLAPSSAGAVGRAIRGTGIGKLAANNEKFAKMTMGKLRVGQMSGRSTLGRTGGRLVAAGFTSSAGAAYVQGQIQNRETTQQCSGGKCPR